MIHSFNHFWQNNDLLSKEARLCFQNFESLGRANDIVQSGVDIQKNPELQAAIKPYLAEMGKEAYKDIDNAVDKQNFLALLMRGMLRTNARPSSYSALTDRSNIFIADPFNKWGVAGSEEKKQADLTQEYFKNKKDGDILPSVIQRNLDVYKGWKKTLNDALFAARIPFVQDEANTALISRNAINRTEYFQLLEAIASGRPDVLGKIRKAGVDNNPDLLREYIRSFSGSGSAKAALDIRNDFGIDTAGSKEMLSRFGIVIGPFVRQQYLDSRKNALANAPTVAEWEAQPLLALDFLSTYRFGSHKNNQTFLDAIQYWYGPKPAPTAYGPYPAPPGGMQVADVKAILSMVVQEIRSSDKIIENSNTKLLRDKEKISAASNLEQMAGNMWEYIKDVREHPVGSIALGILSFGAIKMVFDLLFKKEMNGYAKLAGFSAIGGLGALLYNQQKTGKSLADLPVLNMLPESMRRSMGSNEFSREAGDKSFADLWSDKLDFKGSDAPYKRACMDIIENENSLNVIKWYKEADNAKRNGNRLPGLSDFSGGMRIYGKRFGEMETQQKSRIMYETLHTFFENRGASLGEGAWVLLGRTGTVRDNADLGLAYLERTVNGNQFQLLGDEIHALLAREHGVQLGIVPGGAAGDVTIETAVDPYGRPIGPKSRINIFKDWNKYGIDRVLERYLQKDKYTYLGIYCHLREQEIEAGRSRVERPMKYFLGMEMDENMALQAGKEAQQYKGVINSATMQFKDWMNGWFGYKK